MISAVSAGRWSLAAAGSELRRSQPCNAEALASLPRIPITKSSLQVSHLSISRQGIQIQPRLRCAASSNADSWPSDSRISPASGSGKKILAAIAKGIAASLLAWILSSNLLAYAAAGGAAESSSIGASALGLRIADYLRSSRWPDEAIVFALATLPVLELRGAIPVGYWMRLNPLLVYCLSVAGNMIPVPLVLLYMEQLTTFLTARSSSARKVLDSIYKHTRRKAGPIQEFKWLGLMLFVAVPFPGTGAWTGAMASVVLGMPFWSSFWANFFGVAIAGILVNLLVSVGFNTALLVGAALFAASTFMWSFLRFLERSQH